MRESPFKDVVYTVKNGVFTAGRVYEDRELRFYLCGCTSTLQSTHHKGIELVRASQATLGRLSHGSTTPSTDVVTKSQISPEKRSKSR